MIGIRSMGVILEPLVVVTVLVACGGGVTPKPDSPIQELVTKQDIMQAFSATTLTTTTDGISTDRLAEGATLDITLHRNGTTTGNLWIPEGAEGGGDLAADLSGTYSFDDGNKTVNIDHSADTFVSDMTFTALLSNGIVQLRGKDDFGGTIVRVVLE